MRDFLTRLVGATLLIAWGSVAQAQEPYKVPPQVVVDILNAPATPAVSISPKNDRLLLLERSSMPTIADLAQPMLRLAGSRINPKTFGPHGGARTTGLVIKSLAGGRDVRLQTPRDAALSGINWSPDGTRLAFLHTRDDGVELWVANAGTGEARRLTSARINATAFGACSWMSDGTRLLCRLVPPDIGSPPPPFVVPPGPIVQKSTGRVATLRTYQDLLTSPYDEALYDYYFTSQLAFVDAQTGATTNIGKRAIFAGVQDSPDGNYLLVTRILRPYSYQMPAGDFPRVQEVWDRNGQVVHNVAQYPLDELPVNHVTTLPRSAGWRPTEPATLVWVEALDGGNPRNNAEHRDKVMMLRAPFNAAPVEIARTPERFAGIQWGERGLALISDFDRPSRWRRTWSFQPDQPSAEWQLIWDLSTEDAYKAPGSLVTRSTPGGNVVVQRGDFVYLSGPGASPEGDRPFLDRMNLRTLAKERVWQTGVEHYETFEELLDDDARRILTRRESIVDPPNYYVREVRSGKLTALTNFKDPAPQLTGVKKQLVTYTRADGVPLSGTLYLPPGYRTGTRLPAVIWAYPREFASRDAAGQVRGSPNRFTNVGGASHLFFLTQGYVVFDGPAMPIIGGDTANNSYIEQLVASAQAAVDKIVELGVADRNRIGVGGHSYGAFMTANLLAHSDVFRAGIARSGAYNRTLTPFGFQNEQRTFWEAPEIYARMSPFNYAHRINEPILLIHGMADNNSGTFPVQSERMFDALAGHGGIVRYIQLPHESHGYAARESVLHVVAEMLEWFDTHVKNAKPTTNTTEVSSQP